MAEEFRPRTSSEVVDAVRWASGAGASLAVEGRGSKRGFGRPAETANRIDLSEFSGIGVYEPGELVMNAAPGTPLAAIRAAAAENQQDLAFEPPELGPLLGSASGGSIGGVVACNLAGPRRVLMGAARDHVLGFAAVNGRGEAFKAGGRMFKNVTGLDLCRLIAGSHGTLAVLTDIVFKVLPAAEQARTVLLAGLAPAAATAAMTAALGSPFEVSGAAHLPAGTTCDSALDAIAGRAVTVVRVEGVEASVDYRAGELGRRLEAFGDATVLGTAESRSLWAEIRDVAFYVGERAAVVWRVSAAPGAGAGVMEAVLGAVGGRGYLDWGGGLVWLALPPAPDAHHETVRGAVARAGGHATLVRAAAEVRASVPVFQPQPAPLAAVTARVKASFDPNRVLNPGRMYAGI